MDTLKNDPRIFAARLRTAEIAQELAQMIEDDVPAYLIVGCQRRLSDARERLYTACQGAIDRGIAEMELLESQAREQACVENLIRDVLAVAS